MKVTNRNLFKSKILAFFNYFIAKMSFTETINGRDIEFEPFSRDGSLGWVQAAKDSDTEINGVRYSRPNAPQAMFYRAYAPVNSRLWSIWNDTNSIRGTGKTRSSSVSRNGGTPIAFYCHDPRWLSLIGGLDYIEEVVRNTVEARRNQGNTKLVNGALPVTMEMGEAILDLTPAVCRAEGVAYDELVASESGLISFERYPTHPQTRYFASGIEGIDPNALIPDYLAKFRQVFPTATQIGEWHPKGDLKDNMFVVRPLYLGVSYGDGLVAGRFFDDGGRFFGVRENFFPQEIITGNPAQSSRSQPQRLLISGREVTLEERAALAAIEKGEGFQFRGYTYLPGIKKDNPGDEKTNPESGKRFRLIELD